MTEPIWNQGDVEAVVQAQFQDRLPPDEIMQRLGPNPPSDFLMAIGRRYMDLAVREREQM